MNYELFFVPLSPVMMPLISFIITYHNEPEAFLQACIESIQALPLAKDEAEVIVVDDGSEPQFIIEGDLEVRLIRQEQAGLSVARNTGIANAKGLYIQFVDADDQLIPSAYEAVVEQLRKEEADVVMFRMTKQTPSDPPSKGRTQVGESLPIEGEVWRGSGASYLLHHNLRAGACGYAFKREILGDLRFYPGLLHEDELFTPQLFLRANSLVELDQKAYFYRQHSGTITHSDSYEKVLKRLDNIHFVIKELASMDEPLLERRIRQLTADYLQNVLCLTHSLRELRRRMKALRNEAKPGSQKDCKSFLPLPMRCYSLRYILIALMTKIS